ncbi:transcriptional regulator, AraC family [Cognatiyoonia sediminum]|uniref:Transcriptional regulator, AraC family n=1 Tax=Cognatiyoonia sediminum TaxID=1508389 RepID=A0A1M5PIM8_9RHOB|nr:AraC family transcriptional regulator [Cognatiyoonia sediminum]SHH01600.1 transcriptional regulator, AraC family [Cognatiyoonia sediminum]
MLQDQIRNHIEPFIHQDGLTETGLPGVQLFRATEALPCVPAVYDPSVIAIVSGSKEAVLDGKRFVYDKSQYLCCPTSLPLKAGTPKASLEAPLYGVFISLNARIMNELSLEMENAGNPGIRTDGGPSYRAIGLSRWDERFSDALLRLLSLLSNEMDAAVLADVRVRELYYAILKGDAGQFVRDSFGVGNAIARSIAHVSSNLDRPLSIDDLAGRAHMSRAVFHRKFKDATTMSPIQFVKSMRLNSAAMRIAEGYPVNQAATDVGYVSASQFSRDFKRMYGQSPRQWSLAN